MAYIKYDEVEEDKEDVHHDPHDELQLADHTPGILQGVRQVLALLVYLHRQHTSCCKPGVVNNDNNKIIIILMTMILMMMKSLPAHDELGTCGTSPVSPKQSVLCISIRSNNPFHAYGLHNLLE